MTQILNLLVTTFAFICRDGFIECGTRSVGKKLMKIEIVERNGQLPTRVDNLIRNFYYIYLLTPIIGFIPFTLLGFVLTVCDLIIPIFSKQGKRISDMIFGTVVINELPDRKKRIEKLIESLSELKQKEEIDAMSALSKEFNANVEYQKRLQQKKNVYAYTDQSLMEKILYPVPYHAKKQINEFVQTGKKELKEKYGVPKKVQKNENKKE